MATVANGISNHTNGEADVLPLPNTTYGFVGLGQMGYGMALNLRRKMPPSSRLVVSEISEKRRDQFLQQAKTLGPVEVARSPKEVAERCDIIITMLPQAVHVIDVFTNAQTGFLTAVSGTDPRPVLFIECSTIDVASSLSVRQSVIQSGTGSTFIDAPVSGGPNGANAGTLTLMVGGSEELYRQALPVLRTMGKRANIFSCGPPGAGLATKQINNYLSSVCTLGVCEAMNMGIKYGLDPRVLAGVINVSSGRCYNSLEQNPVKGVTAGAASENDFVGGFSVELCKGVVDMALSLGKQVHAQTVLGDAVSSVYAKAVEDERCKGRDSRSVYRLFVDGNA